MAPTVTGLAAPVKLTAESVKARARELGADGVGIASAAVLNAHPPDPDYPQIPARISPEIRSCIAFFKRIPAGAFRARDMACVHHVDQLVLREMDKIGYRLARFLETQGVWAFLTAAQETIWEMKTASYGFLSTRHVAIEAGLGTLGLELNLLTPECGPRCYTTVVFTDAELEPDGKMSAQLCIGEPCSRCLYSCPADAVRHWDLDKRACATYAQEFGFATILRTLRRATAAPDPASRMRELRAVPTFGIWQGLLRVVGAFGDCPRCLAVCPVGEDYNRFLREDQREIPEKTDAKVALARQLLQIRRKGDPVPGLAAGRDRWIGEAGYVPPGRTTAPR
jgi:epoxyqueuosine reductase QueG